MVLLALFACHSPGGPSVKSGDTASDTAIEVDDAAPSIPGVAIDPAFPQATDDLTVVIVTPSVDPEAEAVSYMYGWTVDGAPRTDLTGAVVGAEETADGQVWTAWVTGTDGLRHSEPGIATVTIGNVSPTAPLLHFEPAAPETGDDLTLVFDAESVDANGDALTRTITWYEDEAHSLSFDDQLTMPGAFVSGGDVFRVAVVVSDGFAPVTTEISVTVANAPPRIDSLGIEPAWPNDGEDLEMVAEASDIDGNELVWSYVWYRDGVEAADVGNSATVPASATVLGETWTCDVTVSDGTDTDTGSDEVSIIAWEGLTYVSTFSAVLTPDGAATGTWALTYLTQGAPGENDCDLVWDVLATEDASVCPTCDYAFDADYPLSPASVVRAGAVCGVLAASGTGFFAYTGADEYFEAETDLGVGTVRMYFAGTGSYLWDYPPYTYVRYYAVTTAEDSAGAIHLDAYEYVAGHY